MIHTLNEGYEKMDRATEAHNKYIKINNKWVLDTSMGVGTHIFGHGTIIPTIKKALDKGTLFIAPNKIADECSELLYTATKFNNFVFCNSGSEATLRCIRIARAYTGRDKIALFEGCWHGTHDWNLAFYSEGIPQAVKDMVLLLPLTNESISRIAQGDIAIAMIEPIQSSLPLNQKEFLDKLREACTKSGTVLCFDEVISGFRSALGGASEFLGIKPDLVSYGKIIGGGFPIGVVGGDDIMGIIKKGRGVRMGGTFSGNPVSMTACKKILNMLIKSNPYKMLHNNVNKLFSIKTDILQVMTLGGMARILFTNKIINTIQNRNEFEVPLEQQKLILSYLLKKGLYIASNNNIMLSTIHTNSDIELIKNMLTNLDLNLCLKITK